MKHTSNCRGIKSFILVMNWLISIKALILNTIPLSINISGGECLEGRECRQTDEKIDIDLLCLFTKPVNTETSGGQLELYITLSSAPEGLPLNKCLHCSEFVNSGNNSIKLFHKEFILRLPFYPLKTKQWTKKANLFFYSQFSAFGRLGHLKWLLYHFFPLLLSVYTTYLAVNQRRKAQRLFWDCALRCRAMVTLQLSFRANSVVC